LTLAEVQAQLVVWKAALTAAASGKAYTIDNRQLTRHNLPEIRDTITWLERKEASLTAEGLGSSKPAALACWNNCSG